VRLAAFTVHIKPRLSANGRVPFLRVYRRRGNPPLGMGGLCCAAAGAGGAQYGAAGAAGTQVARCCVRSVPGGLPWCLSTLS